MFFYLLTKTLEYTSRKLEETKENLRKKYSDFKDLNSLVSTQYDSKLQIFCVSLQMVLKMYWMRLLQWSNDSVKQLDNKNISVSYIINGNVYVMVTKVKKGPKNIVSVKDEKNKVLNALIFPYMGPNDDWHGAIFTPAFWKKRILTFENSFGEKKTFLETEEIKL